MVVARSASQFLGRWPGPLFLAALGLLHAACPPANFRPLANAGPDQMVQAGTEVLLDGSGSTSRFHKPLRFQWTQTRGRPVELTADTSAVSSFTAPDAGTTLRFELSISDGHTSATDAVSVFVRPGDPEITSVTEVASPEPAAEDPLLVTGRLDPAVLEDDIVLPEHFGSGSIQLMPLTEWPVFEELELAAGASRELRLTAAEPARIMARANWHGASQILQLGVTAAGASEIQSSAEAVPPERGAALALVDVPPGPVTITVTNPGPAAVTVVVVVGTLPLTALEPSDE